MSELDDAIEQLIGKVPEVVQRDRRKNPIKPLFDKDDLKRQFALMSRQPFVEVLAEVIQAVPEQSALQEFANSHPNRS